MPGDGGTRTTRRRTQQRARAVFNFPDLDCDHSRPASLVPPDVQAGAAILLLAGVAAVTREERDKGQEREGREGHDKWVP